MSKSRGDHDLVGHNLIAIPDLKTQDIASIKNVLWKTDKQEEKWIEELTEQIALSRAKMRSTYMRWSLSINGLEVAAKKYSDPLWAKDHNFIITSLRPNGTVGSNGGVNVDIATIAQWDGETASTAHLDTIPMLTAYGLIDMYSNLEEIIFHFYRIFLWHTPDSILRGDDFKGLRRLKRDSVIGPTEMSIWTDALQDRIDSWQRKKLYDGLGKVFKSFCELTKIKEPSTHKIATIDSWVESINLIALVRNSLVHGASTVSKEMGTACRSPFAMAFDFTENDPLSIRLYHMQGVELFCEQLFTALNISVLELITGPINKKQPNR